MIERLLSLRLLVVVRLHTALLARSFAGLGHGTRITPPFRFSNLRLMSLGNETLVHRNCWFNALPLESTEHGPLLTIGDKCSIGQGAILSAACHVELGAQVLLGPNVYISDHGHEYADPERPIMLQGITPPRPVVIGSGTWLGYNVCVLPGVSIGRNCVVGANSIVRSNLPDFSVAVGSPARVIKRFDLIQRQWIRVH